MKYCFLTILIFLMISCNNQKKTNAPEDKPAKENSSFFPVTAYLKGQIYDIKERGLTPFYHPDLSKKSDSIPIKFDQLDSLLSDFLQPEIDSTNLINYFTESKFLDQTINAFTFTYDAKTKVPDSIPLIHWNVYVDPETNKVKRIYIVKKHGTDETRQLTWLTNHWCKIVTIRNNPNGNSTIEKEEKLVWVY